MSFAYQQNNGAPAGYYGQQPNNYGMGMGMMPNPAQYNAPKTGNWLPMEDLITLQQKTPQWDLSISPEDKLRAQCNHYYKAGGSALVPDTDGSGGATCAICGAHLTGKEYTDEEVEENINTTIDILEVSKVFNISLPADAALQYYVTIALLKKTPQLYKMAVKDFSKYGEADTFVPQGNMNPFAMFQTMASPMYGMGQVPYGAPQAQPQATPVQGAPMGYNPIYGQYAPQGQGFYMNPQGAAAPGFGYPQYNTNMPFQGGTEPQPVAQPQATPAQAAAPAASPIAAAQQK